MTYRKVRVAVFAHNESRQIIRCLNSIAEATPGGDVSVEVLANGCSDNTCEVVRTYAAGHPVIALRDIPAGDKANAWNKFIHEYTQEVPASYYVFLDGDCYATPHAICRLLRALENNPGANAAAALPATGRSRKTTRAAMVRYHELAGNLYALRGEFVGAVQQRGIRMPFGLIGEDSLVGAMVKFDLDPHAGWRNDRVVVVPEAEFGFDSMKLGDAKDLRTYFNRRVRYSLRRYQFLALRDVIQRLGFEGMPGRIDDLYALGHPTWRVEWRGLDTLFDCVALTRMRPTRGQDA